MIDKKKCRYFDGCEAQFCPMEPNTETSKHIWYPDEGICKKRKDVPDWIRQQRKVKQKCKTENDLFYFTLEMLKIPFRVTSSVKGLDPNKEEGPQLRTWRKRNKGVRQRKVSTAVRKQRSLSMKRLKKQPTTPT